MKKFITASLFLAFTLLLTNCKKDKDAASGTWTSTIDGTTFAGTYGFGTIAPDKSNFSVVLYPSATQLSTYLEISVNAALPQDIAVGTYEIQNSDAEYFSDGLGYFSTASASNKLTISKLDLSAKKASGTFTFKAKNISSPSELNITGSFTDMPF